VDGSSDAAAGGGPTRAWPVGGALALLAAVNLLNNVVAPDLYLLWACLAIVGLVLLARADGLHPRDWGLGPISRRAALAAVVLAVVTAAVMLVGTQLPHVADAYADERVVGMDAGEIAFAALVRVPLGTAFLEEMAFRGVLLAMLARRFGLAWGVAGSAAAAVVAAGVAGVFLCLLRIRYDHLIAPLAVHVTANSMGYLLAWLLLQS